MAYLNKVMLIGNLGKDPEISMTTTGRKKVSFYLATSCRYRDNNGETKESSLSRAFRYYTKGFRMCHGEMKKLFEAIQCAPKEEKRTVNNTVDLKKQEQMSSGELGAFFAGID